MHMDPDATDAFNSMSMGSKWWVALPIDFYEFFYYDDWKCDASCSSPPVDFRNKVGAWFMHILPQIRYASLKTYF